MLVGQEFPILQLNLPQNALGKAGVPNSREHFFKMIILRYVVSTSRPKFKDALTNKHQEIVHAGQRLPRKSTLSKLLFDLVTELFN
jgi:hypothetical protein